MMARVAHIPLLGRRGIAENAQAMRGPNPSAKRIRDFSTPTGGLGRDEAARRLAEFGPNELRDRPPPSVIVKFLAQFTDITVLALIAAAGLAVGLG